jgi:hypothetical protein
MESHNGSLASNWATDASQDMHWTIRLELEIARIFTLAQKTTSSHRKNITHMRNVMVCCLERRSPFEPSEGGRKAEKVFCMTFMKLLSRVLVVHKKEIAGDRVLRFVDAFLVLLADLGPPPFLSGFIFC